MLEDDEDVEDDADEDDDESEDEAAAPFVDEPEVLVVEVGDDEDRPLPEPDRASFR